MSAVGTPFSGALDRLCQKNAVCRTKLHQALSKQIWSPGDRQLLLDSLGQLFLQPGCAADITQCFRQVILDIIQRAQKLTTQDGHVTWEQHQRLCIALSCAANISQDAKRFAVGYVGQHPPFYQEEDRDHSEAPKPKKARKVKKNGIRERDLLQSVYRLLLAGCTDLKNMWDWAPFMDFLKASDLDTRWFAVESVAILLCMSDAARSKFRSRYFTDLQMRELLLRHDPAVREKHEGLVLMEACRDTQVLPQQTEALSHTWQSVVDADLCDEVVTVGGVLLPRKQTNTETMDGDLVNVPSTQRNLRSLSLAVAAGKAVLLQGPVGSGKTSLVEHLARLTGRNKTPHLMKIQLGDQTDSKALLGTYRCTAVPGEFVWQPGSLTHAVTEGHWILLEDIDYAPMDVISILIPIIESNTLYLPGHGGNIKAKPGFQLFATQRLLGSDSGWHQQQGHNASVLEQLWSKVIVEPLSRSELQQVIVARHPQLTTVVDKLLDIYFLLSAGRHEMDMMQDGQSVEEEESVGSFLTRDGRLISTRDLMKWCDRISADFSVSEVSSGAVVLQEALDCFCACLHKMEKRLPLAEAIAARLNITKVKAEFYCAKYKPTIEISPAAVSVGRTSLKKKTADVATLNSAQRSQFAFTRQAVTLLERIAVCVDNQEPVLLVGETGTGKTSSVQFLAQQMGHPLRVINMNQHSDSTDLLGGFKPVDMRFVVAPFREEFETMFGKTFSRKQNAKFLSHIQECFARRKWSDLFKLIEHTQSAALKKTDPGSEQRSRWEAIGKRLQQLKSQIQQAESALAFTFIEGSLVKALKLGEWVLLDEINLATAETLECLSGLLESTGGSIVLLERGDTEPIVRHPDFRLFACMNPATDVGKKDLPPGVRNRFTEFYVDELEDVNNLKILVADYLRGLSLSADQISGIVKFYLLVRSEAVKHLTDGTGHRPYYSLRTLCRALRQGAANLCGSVPRSLYEGFCLSFLTELDRASHPAVEKLICQHVLGKANIKSVLKQPLPAPPGGKHLQFEGYWVPTGQHEPKVPENYILTPAVRANLRDLARVVSAGRHPVLLQGETSVGKTSLVQWLAQSSGNHCVRVNNHEHTDLQEYIGCYAADETGKLIFREGVLIEAMRKGHWIILDELNLAPTDVLEALNRLLDDNRELFIAETQETVRAHPRFMLFATQNPPGQYGGRKILSRAFRNRFVELHFDTLPSNELETILHQRCCLPMSYAKKLVAVLLELQTRRRGSGVFAGKQGFITLRDLFRWAERYRQASVTSTQKFFDWDQLLADNGYMLLAGRVRKEEECVIIQEVLEKRIKRKVSPELLFTQGKMTSPTTAGILREVTESPLDEFQHVVWTFNMRRMAVLVGQALKYGEPVLLVGETGCGKTTICQMFSALAKLKLYSVNCHLHTESSDFLGGLRPVRHRTETQDSDQSPRLFEWCDGPLVKAMREDAMFLIDEISLADDSVLERLNSVLEPERTLLLAEKGTGAGTQEQVDQIVAGQAFRVFATMNPAGDYGKKELSPALRNRFTEIWCPLSLDRDDLVSIIEHNLKLGLHLRDQADGTTGIGRAILDFVDWFRNNALGRRMTISIRDLLSWVQFINTTAHPVTMEMEEDEAMEGDVSPLLDVPVSYIHGACLVFLDALGSGVSMGGLEPKMARQACLQYLHNQLKEMAGCDLDLVNLGLIEGQGEVKDRITMTDSQFGLAPFFIPKGEKADTALKNYALQAPTTALNAQRVLRALQLPRAILLEGSPGVGKTSLVAALAKASGHDLVRINLSEQTDVSDLFGADLPVEGGEGGQFEWRDGPLLRALKGGHWVVLDELNLASQSVLEGLNACLDHRAEIFVPELAMSFQVQHEKTRIFACQNPLNQGGGRKGLPRSFLNRFTQVYIEPLSHTDLLFITETMYPQLPNRTLSNMISFNSKLCEEVSVQARWGQRGGPWEFNLRDIFRWCDLLIANQTSDSWDPGEYIPLIYSARMRTVQDKLQVQELYEGMFHGESQIYQPGGHVSVTKNLVQVGHSFLPRNCMKAVEGHNSTGVNCQLLHHGRDDLENVMKCIEMNWMTILVGPKASGKTSLVHLLATLVGHPLEVMAMNSAMDTTELLGGFEQADLTRHLEVAISDLGQLVEMAAVQLLLSGSDQAGALSQRLVQGWHRCKQHCHTDAISSTQTEKAVFLEKLNHLTNQAKHVHSVCHQGELSEVSRKLEDVQRQLVLLDQQVSQSGSVNMGGRFEWVDSQLVQALQKGHWLLIDNVNFCSPSVLDRLNALLEPNGVLSINERGVIDGQIPTVIPHKDFRLILAMDARYGEISRAMRNRGIEIYILGESEGKDYSDHDVAAMMSGLGVTDPSVVSLLIALHQDMKPLMTGPDRGCVLDLLHTALLLKEELDRGSCLQLALKNSWMSVYVCTQKRSQVKQEAKQLVDQHLERLNSPSESPDSPESQHTAAASMVVPAVAAGQLASDSQLAAVKQAAGILLHAISQLTTEGSLPEVSFLENLKSEVTWKSVIPAALKVTFDHASPDSWQLLGSWVRSQLGSQPAVTSGGETGDLVLENLEELIQSGLEAMFVPLHDQHNSQIKQITSVLGTEASGELLQQPLDLRWNPELMRRLVRSAGGEGSCDLMTSLCQVTDRCQLLSVLTQMQILTLRNLEAEVKVKAKYKLTFLQQSWAIQQGKLDAQASSHPCVPHMYPFLSLLYRDLQRLIIQTDSLSEGQLYKVMEQLQWLWRFSELCHRQVAAQALPSVISLLSLHWGWLYDNCLQEIPNLQSSASAELCVVINKLHSILGQDNMAAIAWTQVRRNTNHPAPYRQKEEAELSERLLQICYTLTPLGLTNWKEGDPRDRLVKFWLQKGSEVSQELINLMADPLAHGDLGMEKLHLIDNIEGTLRAYGLVTHLSMSPEERATILAESTPTNDPAESSQIALWLLREVLAVRCEQQMLGSLQPHLTEMLQSFLSYCVSTKPSQPAHLLAWQHLLTANKQDTWPLQMFQFIQKLWNGVSACDSEQLLSWKPTSDDLALSLSEMDDKKQTGQGIYLVFGASMSHTVSTLLTEQKVVAGEKIRDGSALMSGSISLGEVDQKLEQLKQISGALWVHAGALSNQQRSARNSVTGLVFRSLKQVASCVILGGESGAGTLQELVDKLEQTTDVDHLSCLMPAIQPALSSCIQAAKDIDKVTTGSGGCMGQQDLCVAGKALALAGLVQAHLLAVQGPVDPAHRVAVELGYVEQQHKEVEIEMGVRRWQHWLMTGHQLEVTKGHPYIKHLATSLTVSAARQEELATEVAYRPTPPKFHLILQDTRHFVKTVLSHDHVVSMVTGLERCLGTDSSNGQQVAFQSVLAEVRTWQNTVREFTKRLQQTYPLYHDLTTPFMAALAQVSYGLSLMTYTVEVARTTAELVTNLPRQQHLLEELVGQLGGFPAFSEVNRSPGSMANRIIARHLPLAEHLLMNIQEEPSDQSQNPAKRLLQAALLLTQYEAELTGDMSPVTVQLLSQLCQTYVSAWVRAEEERKKREEEEASLYKFKTQTHGDGLTEEERDEREIQQMFPTFDEDFEDVTIGPTLEDKTKKKTVTEEGTETDGELSTHGILSVSESEMALVSKVHSEILISSTRAPWLLVTPGGRKVNQQEASMLCYQVAAHITKKHWQLLDGSTDGQLVGGHLLASSTLQRSVLDSSDITQSQKPYDIYHDPNVPEVSQCRPLLMKLRIRITELLEEWPDHPTLKQLVTVTDRILSFPVTSPLMKFVTGLEVLLQKAQEWESNAARHVTLTSHLQEVTQMIIQYRKLELRHWHQCLDTAAWQVSHRASRWWFHLYQVVQGFIQPPQGSASTQPSVTEFVKSLQQFMETSTLGEFQARLRLLQAFHCQTIHMEESPTQKQALAALWNVLQFYSQFKVKVTAEVSRKRSPIEKELKGYVKIARWNDLNFWAMKQAVEKTHKTLHKHIKAFTTVLQQPANRLFTDSKDMAEVAGSEEVRGHSSADQDSSLYISDIKLTQHVAENQDLESSTGVLPRLPTLYQMMRKHCRSIFQQKPYSDLIITLDQLTVDIIETVHELQKDSLTEIKDKEKQKKEAKLIHMRKRKSLADLFKYLTLIGLSYRKGLTMAEDRSDTGPMLMDPLDVSASLKQIQNTGCDTEMEAQWDGCCDYYTRCISRQALFHTALLTPSQELGAANISRCRGYTEHLMTSVLDQWCHLSEQFGLFYNLRQAVASVRSYKDKESMEDREETLPPQQAARSWMSQLSEQSCQAIWCIEQHFTLWRCCPPAPTDGATYPTPFPQNILPPVAKVRHQDETWTETEALFQEILSDLEQCKQSIGEKQSRFHMITWNDLRRCQAETVTRFMSVSSRVAKIDGMFKHPQTGEGTSLSQSLSLLRADLQSTAASYERWYNSIRDKSSTVDPAEDDTSSSGTVQVEKLVTEVLLVVQRLMKKPEAEGTRKDAEEKKDEEEEEEETGLVEGHLTSHIQSDLCKDIKHLKLDKITSFVEHDVVHFLELTDTDQAAAAKMLQALRGVWPLLNQYCHLVQYYLTKSIAALRTSAKLLSVLLAIFAELAQKGFCLPAEYSDEMMEDGATEFKDIEGGGMGEGEGVKDVSDQIENEDQLQEAKKEGEEEEKQDGGQQPDIQPEENAIEMNEDFEGKLEDVQATEGNDDSDSENEMDENDIDKQMGDLEGQEADKLDEQLWGSDGEDEEEDKETKDEEGPGAGKQSQPELVAKDDNPEDGDDSKQQQQDQQQQEEAQDEEDGENKKQNNLDQMDEREYDDEKIDPHYGKQEEQQETETMDLPEEMKLDGEEDGEKEEEGKEEKNEDNPYDLDKVEESEDKDEQEGEDEQTDAAQEEEPMDTEGATEEEQKEQNPEPEPMEAEDSKMEDKEDQDEKQQGFEPQDDPHAEEPLPEDPQNEDNKPADDTPQSAETYGKTSHDTQEVEQSDSAQDQAASGENDQDESEGAGVAQPDQQQGHEGDQMSKVTKATGQGQQQQHERKPGEARVDRSLGSVEEKVQRRLNTVDNMTDNHKQEQDKTESDLYEHVKEPEAHYDAQTMDVATADQQRAQQDQPTPNMEDEEAEPVGEDDKMSMMDRPEPETQPEVEKLSAAKLRERQGGDGEAEEGEEGMEDAEPVETPGERVVTYGAERGPVSTIHTSLEHYAMQTNQETDLEELRQQLEQQLSSWTQPRAASREEEQEAQALWHNYEALTSSLSQELCEQLRLVLEPSQATKLKGDYRTGKRLNMRKVIPYIASQFRKDKIWLRRTKPSKRNYQIMLAVDDSSSMADNHSKQLAFESLAVIANALTLLESGQLAVSSFGEEVQVLHPFHEQFSSQAGANVLRQFTFAQKKTKIAQLLKQATAMMINARSMQQGIVGNPETSQLLVVVSDGRGLFLEGMEVVKSAVRQTREANVFVVFVVIDNQENKDSILDIKVPVFRPGGQLPEIKSYMDHFPFPFYLILRDINSLPSVLSDALRQWFELVTAGDR